MDDHGQVHSIGAARPRFGAENQSRLDAALYYVTRLGWRIIRTAHLVDSGGVEICSCSQGDTCREPGDHWLYLSGDLATHEEVRVREWFEQDANANIGLAVGAASHVLALQYSADLATELRPLLDTLLAYDPPTILGDRVGEGIALFGFPVGLAGAPDLPDGLKFRASSGIVTLPPSVTYRGRLRWSGDPSLVPPLPMDVSTIASRAWNAARAEPSNRSPTVSTAVDGRQTQPVASDAQPRPRPLRVGTSTAIVRRMSDVDPVDVEWLWPGYIPFGALTIIQSDPGLGKSTVTLDIAARITTGGAPPLAGDPVDPGNVLLIGREDGLAHTVRPRLDAAGADTSLVLNLSDVMDEDVERPLTLPADIRLLEMVCEAYDVRLVVIDPIVAYLGDGHHALSDHGIRRALDPLAQVAQRLNMAVVLVRHLVKRGVGVKMHHGSGSIGLAAVARSVLHVEAHADGAIIKSVKSSLGPRPDAVLFRLEPVGHHARVEWLGTVDPATAEETRPPTKIEQASLLLLDWLADGPMPRADIEQRAVEEGISLRTFEEAKRALGIIAERSGRISQWRLRSDAGDVEDCGAADLGPATGEVS